METFLLVPRDQLLSLEGEKETSRKGKGGKRKAVKLGCTRKKLLLVEREKGLQLDFEESTSRRKE